MTFSCHDTSNKKILVPLDGSSNSFRGLEVAIRMARELHATIIGLYGQELLNLELVIQ